jgi:hypothetical protein
MDKKRRPDAGQGVEEEGNYVHQYQLEPGLEPMDKEGRPDAGQGNAEECNYVHQPQRKPGPEPMNKEAEEVMAREDLGSGPTLKQTEEAYFRNMINSIVYKLCVF